MSLSLVWLRRDLRLTDHAAFAAALAQSGTIQPVFVFDADVLARFTDPQDRRLSFIAATLQHLHAQLQKKGGGLLVLHGRASEVLPKLAKSLQAQHVFAAEDYEPETINRDAEVAKHAPLKLVKDQVIFSPKEIVKGDGTAFKVYTPYSKAWWAATAPVHFAEHAVNDAGRYADCNALGNTVRAAGLRVLDMPELLSSIGYSPVSLAEWGVEDAPARLRHFVQQKVAGYGVARDIMGERGTSRISPYLRFGLVSVREAFRLARAAAGSGKWLGELIWREFYAMILYHYPESVRTEWNPAYRGTLAWQHNAAHIEAWKAGMTGYPVVDAAMRELLATGWMHNRARMIVASFLTKHLRIDWRVGEEHFAQYLMDYDLASNVGGWQWAASTGTDAQPYFRVFNPYLQSEKFDPDGKYIRMYVPELRDAKGASLHQGWAAGELFIPNGYPKPIVDHSAARVAAIAMFKDARD